MKLRPSYLIVTLLIVPITSYIRRPGSPHTTRKYKPRPTRKLPTLRKSGFQWTPPFAAKPQVEPDWWNLYETPQPHHRYSSDSESIDLGEYYEKYQKGTPNGTPRRRKDRTVKFCYDSYGKLRTIKKLDRNYIEKMRQWHSLDTNSYYGDPDYNSNEEDDDEEESSYDYEMYRIPTTKRHTKRITTARTTKTTTTVKTKTKRTTTTKKRRPNIVILNENSTDLSNPNNTLNKDTTTVGTSLKWVLRWTPLLMPEHELYKTPRPEGRTPYWGFLRTTTEMKQGKKLKKRHFSFKMKAKVSPIQLIVVRQ